MYGKDFDIGQSVPSSWGRQTSER